MNVKILIEGDGLSYSKMTDVFNATQIIAFLNKPESGTGKSNVVSQSNLSLPGYSTQTSPRQALINANAKTNPQKIATLGFYWINTGDEKNTFNTGDLRTLFKKAGESLPQNFTRDIRESVRLSYIYESDQKGEYLLSEAGISIVERGFSQEKNDRPATSRSSGTRKRSTSSPKVREELTKIDYLPDLDGFKNFHNLSTKTEKILWILAFTQTKNIGELASSEIEYIADRLREHIPSANISALTKSSQKSGYIARNHDNKIKLLQKGIDSLKQS